MSKAKKKEKKIAIEAKKFAIAMKKDHHFSKSFANMMWFSVFKAMSLKTEKEFPADHEYYRNKQFFVESKLNIFQRSVIKVFTKFFLFMYNKGIV